MDKKYKLKKMNIAMFGHKRIPSREGGIEVVVGELSTRMVVQGHNVTIYNRSGCNICASLEGNTGNTYKGVKMKDIFTINKKGLAAVTSSVLASFTTAFGKYDIVHIHAEGPAFMCWLPKLFRKRVVVTIHGLDHQRAKWGKFASAYIMMGEKNAVRFADEIIVLSSGVQQYFMKTYGRKTRFIPNGVNKSLLRQADLIKQQWGLEKDNYILYLGRIVPEKGGRYLIEAFKQVKTNKKLVIAGGSSDTDNFVKELKKIATEDERIIFTGFVQGQLLEELYSNAYIYTLPSDLEGMPLSLLEGMSFGNCCLTSNISECAEVIEDKAVTFKKSSVSDLKDKLQMLCDNVMIVNKLKETSAEFICNKYNWDDVVDKTLELYRH